ncbi:type II secretion system F family protein [Nocardia blacklockiae]|uniref:type II secretion system F family protein n=1 Tax=Nocardia blacklockiae TaxID=480036 RepID=UPI001895A6AE|nr:type II secretion system F family protein [Nocardia blacklockiae]MBF6173240.1 type II secretion system F family protein [Nocardia blacklockiae]
MTASSLPLLLSAIAILLVPGRITPADRLRAVHAGRVLPPGRVGNGCAANDPLATASALQLLAACLRSGLPIATAARAVARSAPEPLGTALLRAADLMALGADPIAAWERAATEADTEEVQALARLVRRSARSGSALADAVAELAEHFRAALEDTTAARAERAGVLISGPLGLCFLPAFLCLGIVPVVIGLATHVLEGGLL